MAFLIYKKTKAGNKATYEQIKPLKLGGRDGLMARHIKALPSAEHRSWQLDAAGLLKLAGIDVVAENITIVFDVAGQDATSVCLYELVKIHGSCRDYSTQLALDFAVLVDREIGDDAAAYLRKFELEIPAKPRLLGETLSLSGGPGGGDWKWGTPPMQLGATVVHGSSHGNSHGNSEPCANCHCGRRAATS
ncbi:MAG TPA: hypothetical protein VF988_04815 [Verrucomicrobiae bacterium]